MTIYLDVNIVIYAVEHIPLWLPKVGQRLQQATASGDLFAVSDAVRFECLIEPLRKADGKRLADYARFFGDPSLLRPAISAAVWDRAAAIRAIHGFQAMDSIHLATAVESGCGLFLTADSRLARFTDVPVEVIS